jgi:hypothetical protein
MDQGGDSLKIYDPGKGVSCVDFLTWGWLVSSLQVPTILFSDQWEKYR